MIKQLAAWGRAMGDPEFPGEAFLERVQTRNGWFTPAEVRRALKNLSSMMEESKLQKWISNYDLPVTKPKTVALIMAGNIPLVGFHDLLSVLISGHQALVKMSSDDDQLLPKVLELLRSIDPHLADKVQFAERKLKGFDAIIATGSNNSSRYFEYYFSKYPHVIRGHRTSVAVLTGKETRQDLEKLGEDIFNFYGLGCRNVTKIFIPENFDLNRLFEALFHFKDVILNKKYGNNYDYYRALYLMNSYVFLDNNFMIMKEDEGLFSPPSVLFYERYKDQQDLDLKIRAAVGSIQCIVGSDNVLGRAVPFGDAQCPAPWDYADGVDTLAFLSAC